MTRTQLTHSGLVRLLFVSSFLLLFGCNNHGATENPASTGDGGIHMNKEPLPEDIALVECRPFPDDIPVLGIDKQDYSCKDSSWKSGVCEKGNTITSTDHSANHICLPNKLQYPTQAPSSGNHRPMWGKWGEYKYMPPQRYLHNLEHGGIVFLYHPCAKKEVVDALRKIAKERKPDDGGLFRWILTPYPGLTSTVAVLAWRKKYTANCVKPDEITSFINQNYRKAEEDVDWNGTYGELWIGR